VTAGTRSLQREAVVTQVVFLIFSFTMWLQPGDKSNAGKGNRLNGFRRSLQLKHRAKAAL
jgi:hypothetical protein